MLLELLAFVLLIPAVLIAFYYMFLAVVGIITRTQKIKQPALAGKNFNFAIVIPAHNEALTIAKTLQSCNEIDYPEDKYSVFVIADNCSDSTEEIVLQHNAQCMVRENKELPGKGNALAWCFDKLLKQDFDAFIVLDADCTIDSHALLVFNQYLDNGELVLQANDVSSNPDDSAMSYAVSVGNLIENDLFYVAKDTLGLPVQLRGTGMVLTKKILQLYSWNAGSVVEDMEYSMLLLKNGINIRFIREAKVSSDFPVHQEQLEIQRTRWAGNLGFGKKDAVKLMLEGIQKKSLTFFDLGLSFLVLSRPLVLAELILAMFVSYLCVVFYPGLISTSLFVTALITFAVQAVYFSLGIFLLGLNIKRLYFLFSAPFIIARLALISFVGMMKFGNQSWTKTPRDNSRDN